MNSFTPSSLSSTNDKQAIKKITRWIEAILLNISKLKSNIEKFNVMVTEIVCNTPDCAPIETIVVLIGNNNSRYTEKIPKPCVEVLESDIKNLAIIQTIESIYSVDNLSNNNNYNELNIMIDKLWTSCKYANEKEQFIKYLEEITNKYKLQKDQEVVNKDLNISLNSLHDSQNPSSKPKSQSQKMVAQSAYSLTVRHDKGTRPRGCPCCDPDNIDNIVDKMLFLDCPP